MNSKKYWDYEKKWTLNSLKKMTGERSFQLGFDLFQTSLQIFTAGVKARRPGIGKAALKKEIRKALCRTS